MGNQSWVGVGNGGDCTIHTPANYTAPVYSPMGGPSPVQPSVATPTQAICRGAMTLKGMVMQFTTITGTSGETAALTAGMSIAGASTHGNQFCALSTTLSGPTVTPFTLSDTTHSDAVTDGQTYGVVFSGIGGTATGIVTPSIAFEQDGVSVNYVTVSAFAAPYSLNQSTKYLPIVGTFANGTTEAYTQLYLPYGVTLDHMQVVLSANAASAYAGMRVNAAAGNQSLNVTGAATGRFEDVTHTDALPAASLVDYTISTSGGVATYNLINTRVVSASPQQSGLYAALNGGANNTSATDYCPFVGIARCDPVIGETVINAPFGGALSQLNASLSYNGSSTSTTITLQKGSVGAVQGNQALIFAAGQSTTLVDTTHSDALVAGTDAITLKLVGTVGSVYLKSQAALFTAPGGGAAAHLSDGLTLLGAG